MNRRFTSRASLLAATTLVLVGLPWVVPATGSAAADSAQVTLSGEGGDAVGPVISRLLRDDASSLSPAIVSYTNVDLDQGIAAFVGSAPGTFSSDFAVTERPLTTAEAATAKANGRSYAYVPFAASPVALMTLVPNSTFSGTTIQPNQYCQHIPLNLEQLDGIYGAESPPYLNWGDARMSCTSSPSSPADALPFQRWGSLDPSMETYSLMSLLDSTTASTNSFQAGLTAAHTQGQASTSSTTASEQWPYSGTAYPGGDESLLTQVVGLEALTGAPSTTVSALKLGAVLPIASDWTGAPNGVPWNLPTAAVENAASAFVAPSAGAATAALGDATVAATKDPTTNNLVTFNASASDASAYNNYLMMESYFVVPTKGLTSGQALALAQLIRYAIGTAGQADITALGAAPPTSAMVTADQAVVKQLDAEAAAAPDPTSTTTTTSATTTSTSATSSTAGSSTSATGNTGSGSSPVSTAGSTSGGSLAATGSNVAPLVGIGTAFLVCGEVSRRQILRRRRKAR